jgi:DNA polymerase-3 subunit alpha
MKHVEQAGLVKFDFLGLTTLTILQRAKAMLSGLGIEVDIDRLPLDDPKTYEMLQRGDAGGVFQMEGQGMRDVLRQMRPDRFEDMIAAVALYRPGPWRISPIIAGAPANVTSAASELAGILGGPTGSYLWRRVMRSPRERGTLGSLTAASRRRPKIRSEMGQRGPLSRKCAARSVQGATGVFEPRRSSLATASPSHAAPRLVAYQTAWMKANHPEVFIASLHEPGARQRRSACGAARRAARSAIASCRRTSTARVLASWSACGGRAGDPLHWLR